MAIGQPFESAGNLMKRIVLASLLTAAADSAGAQSNVTMFGTVGGGARWVDGAKGGAQVGFDNNIISGNNFGIRGTEDLGQGLNAIVMLQSGFLTGTGALSRAPATLFSQNAYVGLSGNLGRVTFGRQLNATEDIGVMLDPDSAQGNTLANVPGVLWGGNFFTLDARFSNTVKYVGKFGRFTHRGSYSPGGLAGSIRAGSNVAAGTSFQYQALLLAAAYQKTFNASASQSAQTIITGGTWQLGPARLYFSYSVLSVTGSTALQPDRNDRISAVGLSYQASPFLQFIAAAYYDTARNLGNVSGANGRKLTSYAMLECFLSKRTQLYVEFDQNGFSGAYKKDPLNVSALNLRSDGRAVTGVSMGMITQF